MPTLPHGQSTLARREHSKHIFPTRALTRGRRVSIPALAIALPFLLAADNPPQATDCPGDVTCDTCYYAPGEMYVTCDASVQYVCPSGGCCSTPECCAAGTEGCDFGCHYEPVDCGESTHCIVRGCRDETGCYEEDVACDDHNWCTADSCDEDMGCIHTPLTDSCCVEPCPDECMSTAAKCAHECDGYTESSACCAPNNPCDPACTSTAAKCEAGCDGYGADDPCCDGSENCEDDNPFDDENGGSGGQDGFGGGGGGRGAGGRGGRGGGSGGDDSGGAGGGDAGGGGADGGDAGGGGEEGGGPCGGDALHLEYATGNVFTVVPVFQALNAWGVDLELEFRYDAQRALLPGPLGYGWTHTFHVYLEEIHRSGALAYVVYHDSDGSGYCADARER